jgi:hypothetical protein
MADGSSGGCRGSWAFCAMAAIGAGRGSARVADNDARANFPSLARFLFTTAVAVDGDELPVRQAQSDVRLAIACSATNEPAKGIVPDHRAAVHRGRMFGIGGQHPALEAYRASLLRRGAHAETAAAELACLVFFLAKPEAGCSAYAVSTRRSGGGIVSSFFLPSNGSAQVAGCSA